MPGNPWDDLETQMQERDLGGSPDAAREHWGACSSKLETVFLVAVPAKANRNPARILPGREDVYIIPRADCTPGFEGDGNVYFSPKNIQACLVLERMFTGVRAGKGKGTVLGPGRRRRASDG